MPWKDICNSYCNTSGKHIASLIGKVWGMDLQRQNQWSRDLLTVGYNIQLPLAGLVCEVCAAFSFKECKTELISWHMIFQGLLLGRAVRVHLCRDMHKLAMSSRTEHAHTWGSMEITLTSLPCFLNSCFVKVALNQLMEYPFAVLAVVTCIVFWRWQCFNP